jgi:Xaa-Pro aminopeptidase
MLKAEGCATRRKRLWNALPQGYDALIVADPQHLIYFANYYQTPFLFRSVDAAAVLILEPDRATLIGDSMSQPYLDASHVDAVVAPVWYDGDVPAPERGSLLVRSAVSALRKIRPRRVGVELSRVPAGILEGLRSAGPIELIDLDPIIRPLRRAKDLDELALLRRSIRAADAGQKAGLERIEPGMTELDAYLVVQNASLAELGEQGVVYGDFVSGPRCEEIGGAPSTRKIEKGDLVIVDFSVVLFGYRGDFANTFVVGGGTPTGKQAELAAACASALEAGESRLRAGAVAHQVYDAVRGRFAELGLESGFTTHAGHGVGLGHPEPPFFVPHSRETLVAGDVVAIEPGQYVAGIGGMRYEHNYLVTADGFERLSQHRISITR